jgi:hypothetical protein
MSGERVRQDLAAVEAALASLSPTPCGVDRDRMMFQAGRASAEKVSPPGRRSPSYWLWPCATAATTLLAVGFAALWLAGGGRRVAQQDVQPPRAVGVEKQQAEEQPATDWPPTEFVRPGKQWGTDYFKLRQLVLTQGPDALPGPQPKPVPDAEPLQRRPDHRRMLKQLLEG